MTPISPRMDHDSAVPRRARGTALHSPAHPQTGGKGSRIWGRCKALCYRTRVGFVALLCARREKNDHASFYYLLRGFACLGLERLLCAL